VITGSDQRLKKNFRDLDNSLDKVLKIRGVMYDISEDYLYNPEDPAGSAALIEDGKDEIGLIAQELLDVVPEAVVYDSVKEEYGIRYNCLIPILIEAIKEQEKKIKELDEKLNLKPSVQKDAAADNPGISETVFLGKNHPNPFNQNTTIEYFLPSGILEAALYIYDMQGKQL
jgi:hypothetical protein